MPVRMQNLRENCVFSIFGFREAAQTYRHLINVFERKAKKGALPAFFTSIEFKGNMEAFQMVKALWMNAFLMFLQTGVDKIPTLVHFGPQAFAPTFMPSGAAGDVAKIIEFITKQSESDINIEEAFKPEPNHNGLLAVITCVAILGGLIATGTVSLKSVYQSVYLWGSFVLVKFSVLILSSF